MSGSVPPTQFIIVPQVPHPMWRPPPGFCHFAGFPVSTVRVLQNHWPPAPPKMARLATTETHFLPG